MTALIKQLLLNTAGVCVPHNRISSEYLDELEYLGLVGLLADSPCQSPIRDYQAEIDAKLLMMKFHIAIRGQSLKQIIEKLEKIGIMVGLLKGIHLAKYNYSQPEHRDMVDIDILVDRSQIPQAREVMFDLGYIQKTPLSYDFYKTHHHDIAFYHPQQGQWVEIHRDVLPDDDLLKGIKLFGNSRNAYLKKINYEGHENVQIFEDEFNIHYLIMHWANEFKIPKGVIVFFDVVNILKSSEVFDVNKVIEIAKYNTVLLNALYIVTSYLISVGVKLDRLQELHDAVKKLHKIDFIQLNIAKFFINRYFIELKPTGRILTERIVRAIWKSILLSESSYGNLIKIVAATGKIVLQKMTFLRYQLFTTV